MEPPPDGAIPLALDRLVVRYGERVAVAGLSLTVRPGEIYGLLGSNGAGKSTTMKTVVGLLRPDEGTVRVFDHDPSGPGIEAKQLLGYVPETPLVFDALTPWEFLEFVAGVRRIPGPTASDRAQRYAEALRLTPELHQPIAVLSSGTRQKLLLLAALLHRPPLLVLDEPFHSLDPRSVRVAREMLREHVASGRGGVLLSTHTMEVAERLCDRVGILDHGRLVGEGRIDDLRAAGGGSLEGAFLRLTKEEAGVRAAVRSLGTG